MVLGTMQGYNELRSSVARVELPNLEALSLSGGDAANWLQGQVTNDLRKLDKLPYLDACLVKPTGQIESEIRVFSCESGLVVATQWPDLLQKRVDDYVILEDVRLQRLGPVASLHGPDAMKYFDLPNDWCAESSRFGLPGFEAVGLEIPPHVVNCDAKALDLWTLQNKIPLVDRDSDGKLFPPELGSHYDAQYVAYDKGCYVGQEVLQRIHSRGHTNRSWRVFQSQVQTKTGDRLNLDEKHVGTVTRSIQTTGGQWLFAAIVLNSADTGSIQVNGHTIEHLTD